MILYILLYLLIGLLAVGFFHRHILSLEDAAYAFIFYIWVFWLFLLGLVLFGMLAIVMYDAVDYLKDVKFGVIQFAFGKGKE